jgi:hypothetical protein
VNCLVLLGMRSLVLSGIKTRAIRNNQRRKPLFPELKSASSNSYNFKSLTKERETLWISAGAASPAARRVPA